MTGGTAAVNIAPTTTEAPLPVEIILNAAATLENWLRHYPDWKKELREQPGPTGPVISPDSTGYGGGGGDPTASAAMERAERRVEKLARVTVIDIGLAQIPERLREVVEFYYFTGIYQRPAWRHAALAHLLQVAEIHKLLTN